MQYKKIQNQILGYSYRVSLIVQYLNSAKLNSATVNSAASNSPTLIMQHKKVLYSYSTTLNGAKVHSETFN